MDDNYLIPANSKKSMLILGFFTMTDLIIFASGVGLSLLLLIMAHGANLKMLILMLIPGLVSTFLVLPVPYYHNMLQLIKNVWSFIFKRRRYYWKGWCIRDEEK